MPLPLASGTQSSLPKQSGSSNFDRALAGHQRLHMQLLDSFENPFSFAEPPRSVQVLEKKKPNMFSSICEGQLSCWRPKAFSRRAHLAPHTSTPLYHSMRPPGNYLTIYLHFSDRKIKPHFPEAQGQYTPPPKPGWLPSDNFKIVSVYLVYSN